MNESDRSFCPPETIGGRTPYSAAAAVKNHIKSIIAIYNPKHEKDPCC